MTMGEVTRVRISPQQDVERLVDAVPSQPAFLERARRRRWVAPVVLTCLAVVLVGGLARAYPALSPYDEPVHFDYVDKVRHGGVASRFERIDQSAKDAIRCFGIDQHPSTPPCDMRGAPLSHYPQQGFNTASVHTPAYYGMTAVGAQLVEAIPGWEVQQLTAARLVGAGWLAAGLTMMLFAGRAWGIEDRAMLPVVLLVACTPVVLNATTRVNNDAPSLLAGGLLLTLLLGVERGRRVAYVMLPFVAALSVAWKSSNILAVGVVVGMLLLSSVRGDSRGRHLITATASAAAALGTHLGWSAIAASIALEPPTPGFVLVQNPAFHIEELPATALLLQMPQFLTPLQGAYIPPVFDPNVMNAVNIGGNMLLLAALGASILAAARWDRRAQLASLVVACAALGAPAIAWTVWRSEQVYFALPPRYGLALVPMMAVLLATWLAGSRVKQRVAWALTAPVLLFTIGGILD